MSKAKLTKRGELLYKQLKEGKYNVKGAVEYVYRGTPSQVAIFQLKYDA